MNRICGTCDHIDVINQGTEKEVHICRGKMPTPALVMTETGPQVITLWAQVFPMNDRCGEWKCRPDVDLKSSAKDEECSGQ